MSTVRNEPYPVPPQYWDSPEELGRLLSQAIRGLLDGESNNTYLVTLEPDVTTTTVSDPRVRITTVPLITPCSSSAAAEIASVWATVGKAVITLHHPSNPATDRLWGVAIFG